MHDPSIHLVNRFDSVVSDVLQGLWDEEAKDPAHGNSKHTLACHSPRLLHVVYHQLHYMEQGILHVPKEHIC